MNPYLCIKCYKVAKLWYHRNYGEYLWQFCKECGNHKWRKIRVNTKNREVISELMKKKMYSVPELAKKVNRSIGMIRYWVLKGSIPFLKLSGHVVFSEDDLDAIKWFIANQGTKRGVKIRR